MKVLVAGGAGYIGSHVVLELLQNNFEVVVVDNLSTGHEILVPKNVKLYKVDITDDKEMDKVFEIEKIDCVMDFAAKIVVPESVSNPIDYYFNNFEGVRIILKNMVKHNVKNIVFSSTAAVYGEPETGVCFESDQKLPINPYGESKLAAENLIKWVANAHNINYFIFRYFNVAGADKLLRSGLISNKLTHIVPIVTDTMLGNREKMFVYGIDYNTPDGSCIRDYVHVSDLADAHVLGLKYLIDNNKSQIVNLGSNSGFSVLELIHEGETIKKVNYEIGPRRDGDPAKLIASNTLAKEILNWEPKISLHDMILSDYNFRKKLK